MLEERQSGKWDPSKCTMEAKTGSTLWVGIGQYLSASLVPWESTATRLLCKKSCLHRDLSIKILPEVPLSAYFILFLETRCNYTDHSDLKCLCSATPFHSSSFSGTTCKCHSSGLPALFVIAKDGNNLNI